MAVPTRRTGPATPAPPDRLIRASDSDGTPSRTGRHPTGTGSVCGATASAVAYLAPTGGTPWPWRLVTGLTAVDSHAPVVQSMVRRSKGVLAATPIRGGRGCFVEVAQKVGAALGLGCPGRACRRWPGRRGRWCCRRPRPRRWDRRVPRVLAESRLKVGARRSGLGDQRVAFGRPMTSRSTTIASSRATCSSTLTHKTSRTIARRGGFSTSRHRLSGTVDLSSGTYPAGIGIPEDDEGLRSVTSRRGSPAAASDPTTDLSNLGWTRLPDRGAPPLTAAPVGGGRTRRGAPDRGGASDDPAPGGRGRSLTHIQGRPPCQEMEPPRANGWDEPTRPFPTGPRFT